MYIRTTKREYIVQLKDVQRVVNSPAIYSYALLLKDGQKVTLPTYTVAFSPAYSWIGEHVEGVSGILFKDK